MTSQTLRRRASIDTTFCHNYMDKPFNDKSDSLKAPPSEGLGRSLERSFGRSPLSFGYDWANPLNYKLLKEFASSQKSNPTEAEKILWERLSKKQLGVRFRRQYIIDEYIADFVCLPKKLIVEVDGGYHDEALQQIADAKRTERLRTLGFKVIRFTNEDVLENLERVIYIIKIELL